MHRRAALERRHTLILVALLAALTLGVTYATIQHLYIVAMGEERSRLTETAQSQARLIEAIARSNLDLNADLAVAVAATLDVVRAAHAQYAGLGRTGEFTLGRRDGDSIVFLLIQRHSELMGHAPILFQAGLAEPMHRALSGESGTMIGRDFRGVTVLAAYEPVAVLDLGIVAKIDLAEIQGKYRDAGLLTLGPALAAIVLGAFLFTRLTRPIVQRIGESEQRYRDVVELMTDGLVLQDADGTIVYANDPLCGMTGRTRQDLAGRRLIDLFAADSREEVSCHVKDGHAGASESYAAVVQRADGTTLRVLVAPRPVFDRRGAYEGSFAVLSEVTALIEAQSALRSEKERAQQYLDIVGVMVVALDAQGRIELINRRGLEILGYEASSDLVGREWFSTCVPEEFRGEVRRVFTQMIAGDLRPVGRYDNAVVTRDGRRRLIHWHNALLRDPEGRILGTLGSGEDVTERRRDELALSRRAMQLQIVNDVSQRLSSILNLDELLLHVVRAAQEGFGFYHADIFLIEERREYAVFRVGSDPAETFAWRALGFRCRVGEHGMVGWVAATGEPLLAGDVSKEPRFRFDKLIPDTQSELVLPISHEGRVLGVLDLQSEEPDAFAPDDLSVMTTLCGQLGAAIENARLYEALKTSESTYRLLLQNANDAVYVHAVTPDSPGRFLDVNDKACEMLGYTREEFLAMDIPRIDVPEQAERLPAILKRLFAESRVVFETEHVAKDGRRIPVEVSVRLFDLHGVPTVLSVTRDMTERRRAEAALRESEAKHRSLFENAVLGIYVTSPDGKILAANPALTSMLGYETFEELAARDLEAEGYPPEYPRSTFKERLDEEGRIVGLESAWTREDGSVLYVRENATAIRDADGRVLFYEGTVEDITQRREMEEENLELEARLRQAQRLESVGTLASGVAHEINNPLTGIINYAQLIADRTDNNPLREFARGIVDEGNRIAAIVKNLLSFSRQQKESHSPARVADIVTASLSLVGAVLRKDGIRIDVEVPDDLPSIKCRSQQIQQVLLNLLTNARDGLNTRYPGHDEDKIVRLSARKVDRDGHAWIQLAVEDHGAGIPPSVLGRVFDPFFTTKPRDQGTGLGLSISYGIVRDHHGMLTAESIPNRSTQFLVELPVDNDWNLSPPARGTEGERRA
jgi:PAS domain S-box-containing protein